MGRQQFYKGNPELKQYFLVNDFSGGINTVDVDERTEDNEFRELLNVELIRAGMIQNRKGWGQFELLNALISDKNLNRPINTPAIELPRFDTQNPTGEFAEKYALIKVVRNDGNLLTVLENYADKDLTLNTFKALNLIYRLEILLVYEVTTATGGAIRVSLLTLSNNTALDGIKVITTFPGIQFDENKLLTNIETIEYTDFLYFSLSQIKSALKGLFEYNIPNQTFRLVRDDETPSAFVYKPTPYEVSKIGFNVLSTTPLTDIAEQIGFLSITGLFLTTYSVKTINNITQLVDTSEPITNFPDSGKVTINVLYTGADVEIGDFTLEFYTMGENLTTGLPEERPVDFTIDATALEATSGIARFACNVEIKNNPTVYIRLKLLSGLTFSEKVVTRTFTTTNDMVSFYNPAVNTRFAIADGTSRFNLYRKTNVPYQYELETSFQYNPGSGVQTFTPIYNDINILATNTWEEVVEGGAAAFANAASTGQYRTQNYNEFTNMTTANVPASANGLPVGHIYRVQKSEYFLGVPKQVTLSFSSESAYNQTTNRDIFINQRILAGSGLSCDAVPNTLDAEKYASLVSIAVNNRIYKVYNTIQTIDNNGNRVDVECSQTTEYFRTQVIEGTNNYYTDASPAEYRYFRVKASSAELINPIVTYNPQTSKLLYRVAGQPAVEILTASQINSINLRIPKKNELYLAVSTSPELETSYYQYDGGNAGDITDFEQATFVTAADTSIYTDVYPVTSNPNPKKVEALDLTGFRLIEINNRLVLYKNNIIWFSDLYQFDYIPNYNYIILPLTADDFITGITYFKGSYMIFTKERIYKMSGTFGTGDFQIQIVSDAIGCISPYSIKAFNNTIVFMTHDGLYRMKQNYYSGGLENVEKIDKQLDGVTPNNVEVYSFLYNEQYILMYDYKTERGIADPGFNVLKMYYNMSAPKGFPYVKDKYTIMPNIVSKLDTSLYSVRYGKFYKYDVGYTDFLPPGEVTQTQINNSVFTTKIRTHKLSFGYPTHEKKFKQIIVKDIANEVVPLYFDIYVNNFRVYRHTEFVSGLNDLGEIVYEPTENPVFIGSPNLLADFALTEDQLGDLSARVHKITIAGRGKDIVLDIERRTAQQFSIQDIGYVYKMGKAREDR
jgi:hypothetical protein